MDTPVAAHRFHDAEATATRRHRFCDDADRLLERYDLTLAYQPTGNGGEERFETHLKRLQALLAARNRLPDDCRYRLLVNLDPEAPELPGWSTTDLSDASHLQRQDLGGIIGTARIGVQMEFWGY